MAKGWYQAFVCLLAAAALSLLAAQQGRTAVPAGGAAEVGEESGSEPLPKYVALTFDDGPRADTTSVLLEGLQQRGVKVTFFLIGEQIEGNEWLVRWMAENGHRSAATPFSHQKLAGSGKDTILQEINKTEVLLSSVLGEGREYWLRPPYGLIDEAGKNW